MHKGNLLAEEDDGWVPSELTVNKEYAARLQHNKEREAWHRMKEKHPELASRIEASSSGRDVVVEDSGDSTSDDDDEGIGGALDDQEQLRFLKVLSRIKQRDQTIYDPGTQLFLEEDAEGDGEGGSEEGLEQGNGRKEKQTKLKDVLARQALAGEAETSDDDEAQPSAGTQGPTYVEEQEQYRQAFLREVEKEDNVDHGSNAFGNVLRKKRQILPEPSNIPQAQHSEHQTQALLDVYFGKDSALPEDEQFLKNYISMKGWVDRGDGMDSLDAMEEDVEEDEQYLEAADRFEAQYNHRFEEPGAANIITYPRNLEGIVRKKDVRRKTQRESRAQRKAAEAAAMEETVKRLKTHKRRELQERLARVKEVSGNAAAERMLADVLGKPDLDLDEYDKAMAAAFDDSYYQADDEELGSPDPDVGSDDTDAPPTQQIPELDDAWEDAAAWEQDDDGATKADLVQLMDDYHKLDAEDYAGGVACRFHYREVPATSYGLSILDVLRLPDKELNQVVGMKRLAPYREDGGATRPNYGKLRELQATEMHLSRKKSRVAKPRTVTLQLEKERLGKAASDNAVAPSTAGQEPQPELPASAAPFVKAGKTFKKRKTGDGERPKAMTTSSGEGVQQASKRIKKVVQEHKEAKGQPAHGGDHEPGAAAAAKRRESRMASFAKPTLNKPYKASRGKMSKQHLADVAEKAGAGSTSAAEQHLTKAQKKNLWRQKRRASLRDRPG